MDIYRAAKRQGKYPPLSPTLRWIIVLVYTTQLISFPDLLWTKPKARSGQIQFASRDHLSGMWQGRQVRMPNINSEQWRPILSHTTSLRHAYDMTWEYSLESLNFVACTKPNKHKMRLKGFFYNLAGFVFEYFCDSGRRILATFTNSSFTRPRFLRAIVGCASLTICS